MNAYGLPRDIPDPIKRVVRQRCGFGCIFCGCAIVQYHHFSPDYKDATEHRSEGITLLCGRCHDKVTRGLIGSEEIQLRDTAPFCKQQGFAHDFLFTSRNQISLQIGSATFKRHAVITFDDELLVGFASPVEPGEPLRLFAKFIGADNQSLLHIIDNTWVAGVDLFDVETSGNQLTIRTKPGEIALRMVLGAGGDIRFDRLKMHYNGFQVYAEKGQCVLRNPSGGEMTLICPNIHSTLRLSSSGAIRL